jgi:hypothetical protein
VDSFADSLQHIICRARFICYLYLRLPEDTLAQVAVQEQRYDLDILWFQLDNLLWTVIAYRLTGIPKRWFSALATTIRQFTVQLEMLYDQLEIDLAHLNQPDPTPSVAQAFSIAARTWLHFPPPYGTWYQRRR